MLTGSRGSSTTLLAGALALRTHQPILLVVAHLDEADEALDDLKLMLRIDADFEAERFGALEVLPGESSISLELLAERLAVTRLLAAGRMPNLLVAPIQALMQAVPTADALDHYSLNICTGQTLSPGQLLDWLDQCGYRRTDTLEQPADFATRGGIIDLYPPAGTAQTEHDSEHVLGPIRLDYFGDTVESIHQIDLETMGSAVRLERVQILGAALEQIQNDEQTTNLLSLLPDNALVVLHEMLELAEQARGYYERLTNPRGIYGPEAVLKNLATLTHVTVNQYGSDKEQSSNLTAPIGPLPNFAQDAAGAMRELGDLAANARNSQIVVLCQKPAECDRLRELLAEHAPDIADQIEIDVAYLHRGFTWNETKQETPDTGLYLIPHHELFHRYQTRRRLRRISAESQATDAFLDMEVGDYVVHADHGIARFVGLKTLRRGGMAQEYLTLEFAAAATLHVPATQIDLIQRYVGASHGNPPLSMLGGKRWANQKQQVAEAVKDMAADLLRLQAARSAMPGIRYPDDTSWQREFEAEFPYEETEDQLATITQVKTDMSRPQPMDRLICGDVGFGKTEIAIRAAFKAAEFGRQVAVLVPTTVLAEQHERTFRDRMADYPFRIESISRFKTGTQQDSLIGQLAKGQIDVIIGTHRLLSKDVRFADLGMVIIDEEQRFGVEHKNRLFQFRLTADVLTLTATPIPRTLHMSMLGLRDISSLTTAPLDRRSIVTEVIPYNKQRIKQAIIREMNREGQVFFVHNRVHNIETVADEIHNLVPDARILVGHGQMPGRDLEKVMLEFVLRKADVLVCTTIIESGIDIPTANTMFINNADHFGLADLHQLRGRVGRYKHRAYCYMLLPEDRPITDGAGRRLKAIEQYSMLGAGFKIAMRDLEIRGAGNLLGAEQSGHIAAVGYEMYCRMLERATRKLTEQPLLEPARAHLELGVCGTLPRRYIKSDKHRMEAYRRISRAATLEALEVVAADLRAAYGEPPATARTLLELTELRIAATHLEIDSIKLDGPDLIFASRRSRHLDPLLKGAPGRASIIDDRTVYYRPPANYLNPTSTLLTVLRKLLVNPVRKGQAATAAAG